MPYQRLDPRRIGKIRDGSAKILAALGVAPDLRLINAPREHGKPHKFDAYLIEKPNTYVALVVRTLAQGSGNLRR